MVSKSVEIGDINPLLKTERIYQKILNDYLSDSTVMVVLIGRHTWQRKSVDWEIGTASDRQKKHPIRAFRNLLPT